MPLIESSHVSPAQNRERIVKLLAYGWPDRIIAKYLMIKPKVVKYYRKKYKIQRPDF